MEKKYYQQLAFVLDELNLQADDNQYQQWLDYLILLEKWNKTYNLTAIRDFNDMLSLHLYDSLSIAPYIQGKNTLDVGTGAGIPGVILAILFPKHEFTLIDSVGKKISFLNHVKLKLKLKNINPINTRVEKYQANNGFDNIISRAFTSLDQFYDLCKHLIAKDGQWLAMKGQLAQNEVAASKIENIQTKTLKVPFLNAERYLLVFS